MLVITILCLLLSLNLVDVITEKTTVFYKDVRFWMVIVSLIALIMITLQNYPIS